MTLIFAGNGWAQPIFLEDFSYANGTAITANGWTAHNAGGTNPILVTNPSTINYTGYLSSGVGGEVTLTTSGEDDNKTFTAQTSGTVYFSFLVYVTSANTSGDYFFNVGPNPISTFFRGRVFVKRDASNNLSFGIAQSTTPVNYSSAIYALNTTYLIVLKYDIVAGTSNDISSIYINPPLNAPIPVSGWIANTDVSGTDYAIGSLALRQGNASNAAALKLDGIRVSANWADIVGVTSTPNLTINPTSLSGFSYIFGSGPSSPQTYALSGSNLIDGGGPVVVACTTNYEVSLNGTDFYGSVNVPYSGTVLDPPVTIHVRLEAGLATGPYNSEIVSNTGGGASVNLTCNGSVLPPPTTYIWAGTTDSDWQVSTNWNPSRTSPAVNDVLQFSDGVTYLITNVLTQTIGTLTVSAGTKITMQAAASSAVLTIGGATGDDLVVTGSGSELNFSGTNTLTVSLSSGATGVINGSMTFTGAAHKLLAASASALTFASGSVFTAGTGFTGNVFGTTSLNSVVFQGGSTYIQGAGSNPFGANAPFSVVTFQTGSLFKVTGTATPSLSGRTYADFEMDSPTVTITVTGGSATSIDNLTITNGIFNFNMTGTPGHSIKGNIFVATGATLNFNPLTAGTVNLNGTAAQTISGPGTINSSGTFSTINVANASGVTLNAAATFNYLTVTSGSFTIAAGANVIINGTAAAK